MPPFDGNGNFTLSFDWNNDAANGIPITASRVQSEDQNIADGLSMCLTVDGQSTTTATIPFAQGVKIGGGAATLSIYDQGTWTPTDASGSGVGLTVTSAAYIKIGKLVTVTCAVNYNSPSGLSNAVFIGGLPFAATFPISGSPVSYTICGTDSGKTLIARVPGSNGTQVGIYTTSNISATISDVTSGINHFLGFSITYISAA